LEWLLSTRATDGAADPPAFGLDPHLIPVSALVVVLTPLLGMPSAEMIATLARAGRVVVAVDTPRRARRPGHRRFTVDGPGPPAVGGWSGRTSSDSYARPAYRSPSGSAAGSLDQVLRDMTRMAAAPKIVRR